VPDTHVCPEATNDAKATPFTAEVRSASSKTIIGAWVSNFKARKSKCHDLLAFPPSSAVNAAKLEPTTLPRERPVSLLA
jgi:hypothetical protein